MTASFTFGRWFGYSLPCLESHFPSTTEGFHAEVSAFLRHWHSHYLGMACPDAPFDFLNPDTVSEFDTMVWCSKINTCCKPTINGNVLSGHFDPTPSCNDINPEIRVCINSARSQITSVTILRAQVTRIVEGTLLCINRNSIAEALSSVWSQVLAWLEVQE